MIALIKHIRNILHSEADSLRQEIRECEALTRADIAELKMLIKNIQAQIENNLD